MLNTSFNSTLVQLKVVKQRKNILRKTCFNSTLVQLKVFALIINRVLNFRFNSTLVQLKALWHCPKDTINAGFNSTLVQLKASLLRVWQTEPNKFQFYLSSIKSCAVFAVIKDGKCFNSTLVQLKAVKNANKYTSKSMIYHPFILIFYKHLQSTFNS